MTKLPVYISSTHMETKADWTACLKRAAEMGFDGVELFEGEQGASLTDMSDERCAAIARCATQTGLALAVHPWIQWAHLPEDDMRRLYARTLEVCARLGARQLNMHMGFISARGQEQRLFAATDACVRTLHKEDITLYYENVPDNGIRELGSEADDFDALFARFGEDARVMMNIDTGHAHVMHHMGELAGRFGSRWAYTHVHDNDGTRDQHTAPGDGTCDFAALASLARSAGYHGPLMMEFHETGLKRGMPVIEKAFGGEGFALSPIAADAPREATRA